MKRALDRMVTDVIHVRNMVRKEIDEMISDAAAHGELYLLAKRMAETLEQDKIMCYYHMSTFPGLSHENKHDVLNMVRDLMDQYDVSMLEECQDISVRISKNTEQSRPKVHPMVFWCNGVRYKFCGPGNVWLELFDIQDTFESLPSFQVPFGDGSVTWYEFTAETFDPSQKDYVFFDVKRKKSQERPTKKQKPLQAPESDQYDLIHGYMPELRLLKDFVNNSFDTVLDTKDEDQASKICQQARDFLGGMFQVLCVSHFDGRFSMRATLEND